MASILTPACADRKSRRQRALALAVAALLGSADYCFGATRTWDNSTSNTQWSNATNWTPLGEPATGDPVILPDPHPAGQTAITLSAGEVASSLTCNRGYILVGTGATLSLTTGNVICNTTESTHLNVQLNGTAGLNKSGSGPLHFDSTTINNLFTGTVTIAGGTLQFIDDANLGNGSNPISLNSGTLRSAASLSMTRALTIGIFFPTIEQTGTWTMNGGLTAASGSNPLSVFGTGTWVLTASGAGRTGQTHIQNGTVLLHHGSALGSGASLISNNGRLALGGAVTHSNFMFLQSNGTFRTAGTGAVHNGQIFVDASGSNVFLNAGDNSAQTLQLGGATNDYTGGAGAKTIVNGLGRITISSTSNNYAGDWQIDSGTLRTTGALSLGTGTSPVVINNTGTLQLLTVALDRDVTMNTGSTLAFENGGQSYGTHTIASSANVTMALKGTGSETLGSAANDLTGGNLSSNIAVTSETAGNTLMLSQPSNYAGSWTINTLATVRAADPTALGSGGGAVNVNAGGTLEVAGTTLAKNVTLQTGSTLRGTGTAATTGTVTVGTATLATASASDVLTIGDAANEFAGGTVTTTVSGPGTVVLPFSNNYPGSWQVNAGTLRVGHATALGTNASAVVVNSGGRLEIAGVTLDRAITLNSGGTLAGAGAAAVCNGTVTVANAPATIAAGASVSDVFTIGNAANDLTGGGISSSMTVSGAGKVVLPQASNYVGNWSVLSGTLEMSADNQLGNSLNSVSLNGGTLATTATFTTGRAVFSSGGTINTASGTTFTVNGVLGPGAGLLTKEGAGTLALPTSSSRTGATTVNAGTVQLTGSANGLGTGTATFNSGTTLELSSATVSSGGLVFNGGSTLRATGTSSYSESGSPQITNALADVNMTVVGASDVLSIGSAIRSDNAAPSSATIHVNGAGRLVLQSGGTSATDIFGGSWEQSAGILQVGQTNGNSINGLGFKNGDAEQANTITVNNGTLAVGVLGSGANTPAWLRANVNLAGGNIASTNGIDAQFGGDFITASFDTSRVLVYDPASTSTVRNVNLVAGAAGVDNLAGATTWAPATTLIIDPGTTTGGAFNITRDGGTITVGPNAKIQINAGATVNLGGTADALSDGVRHVSIVNNSTTTFNVTAGSKNAHNISGVGSTIVGTGATLTATHFRQANLSVSGTAVVRQSGASTSTSVLDTLSPLTATGKIDLKDNKLIFKVSPIGSWTGTAYTGVTGWIAEGRNGGAWDGSKIVTSMTDATTSILTTLAVATAGDVGKTTFGGQSVASTDTLVMYTYGGDANLSGFIDADDYFRIDSNYGETADASKSWFNGDFNYDGLLDGDDYLIIDANFSAQGAPFSAGAGVEGVTAVPEPASLALVALGAAMLPRRRR